MKKLEKAWIFIWAGVLLLFGLLTVNGLRFQYGDTVKTIVRGVDDLNLGSDLSGGLELALSRKPDCRPTSRSWTVPGRC